QKNPPRNCGRRRWLKHPHRITPAATRGSPLPHFSLPCWGRESPALSAGGRGLRPYQLSLAESSVLPHQSKSGNAGDGSQCLHTKKTPPEAGPSVRVFGEEGVFFGGSAPPAYSRVSAPTRRAVRRKPLDTTETGHRKATFV